MRLKIILKGPKLYSFQTQPPFWTWSIFETNNGSAQWSQKKGKRNKQQNQCINLPTKNLNPTLNNLGLISQFPPFSVLYFPCSFTASFFISYHITQTYKSTLDQSILKCKWQFLLDRLKLGIFRMWYMGIIFVAYKVTYSAKKYILVYKNLSFLKY